MFKRVDAAKGLDCRILSADGGPVKTVNGLRFEAHASFAEAPTLDVLWVPGGSPEALSAIMSDTDSPFLAYLRQVAADALWVCSVCMRASSNPATG